MFEQNVLLRRSIADGKGAAAMTNAVHLTKFRKFLAMNGGPLSDTICSGKPK